MRNLICPICELSCACTDLVTIHPLLSVWNRVLTGTHPNSVTVLMYFAAETEVDHEWAEATQPDQQVREHNIGYKGRITESHVLQYMMLSSFLYSSVISLYLFPLLAAALPPRCWPGVPVRDQRSFPTQPVPAGKHSLGSPAGGSLRLVASCSMCGSCS